MSNDNVDESHNMSNSNRFTDWVLLFIFSLIAVGAAGDQKGSTENGGLEDALVWISALSLILSIVAIGFYLSSNWSAVFINAGVEGAAIIYLVVTWCVAVAIATDSQWELAVDAEGRVKNGNIYYFSWAAFIWSVGLLSNFTAAVYSIHVYEEVRRQGKRMTTWASLLVVSIVVMSNSAHIQGTACMGENPDKTGFFCGSAAYGIALGVLCATISIVIIGQKIKQKQQLFMREALLGALICLFYAMGVAIITSNGGAAAPLGNLYYATWIGFLTSCTVVKSCWSDYEVAKSMNNQSLSDSQDKNSNFGPQVILDNRHTGDDDI